MPRQVLWEGNFEQRPKESRQRLLGRGSSKQKVQQVLNQEVVWYGWGTSKRLLWLEQSEQGQSKSTKIAAKAAREEDNVEGVTIWAIDFHVTGFGQWNRSGSDIVTLESSCTTLSFPFPLNCNQHTLFGGSFYKNLCSGVSKLKWYKGFLPCIIVS